MVPLLFAQYEILEGLACCAVGLGVGILVWWVLSALASQDLQQEAEWRYDVSRINALRRLDPTFRLFQPLIQVLAKLNRAAMAKQLPEVYRQILAAGLPRYWLPEEYLARGQVL